MWYFLVCAGPDTTDTVYLRFSDKSLLLVVTFLDLSLKSANIKHLQETVCLQTVVKSSYEDEKIEDGRLFVFFNLKVSFEM